MHFKYCDFVSYKDNLYLIISVKNIKDDVYEVLFKDLKTGITKRERFTESLVKKLGIKKVNLKYEKYEFPYHYFIREDNFQTIKINRIILGTKINYIKGDSKFVELERVEPVFTNVNPDNIKENTKVEFWTNTKGAKIYYTLDGSIPSVKSNLYTEPFVIKENCTIRLIAVKEGMKDSFPTDFNFKLKNRTIRIYLSPSNQHNNLGIKGSNFKNERYEMNKICDILMDKLRNYDVILFRNSKDTFIENWLDEGRENCVDLHFAIHSNASSDHVKKGMENWINECYSPCYSLAYLIYKNLYSIYYDNKNPLTDRGIKYSRGVLTETNPARVNFGINLEIAYHDNMEDAKWIVQNREKIAENIANSLISYYQLDKK